MQSNCGAEEDQDNEGILFIFEERFYSLVLDGSIQMFHICKLTVKFDRSDEEDNELDDEA